MGKFYVELDIYVGVEDITNYKDDTAYESETFVIEADNKMEAMALAKEKCPVGSPYTVYVGGREYSRKIVSVGVNKLITWEEHEKELEQIKIRAEERRKKEEQEKLEKEEAARTKNKIREEKLEEFKGLIDSFCVKEEFNSWKINFLIKHYKSYEDGNNSFYLYAQSKILDVKQKSVYEAFHDFASCRRLCFFGSETRTERKIFKKIHHFIYSLKKVENFKELNEEWCLVTKDTGDKLLFLTLRDDVNLPLHHDGPLDYNEASKILTWTEDSKKVLLWDYWFFEAADNERRIIYLDKEKTIPFYGKTTQYETNYFGGHGDYFVDVDVPSLSNLFPYPFVLYENGYTLFSILESFEKHDRSLEIRYFTRIMTIFFQGKNSKPQDMIKVGIELLYNLVIYRKTNFYKNTDIALQLDLFKSICSCLKQLTKKRLYSENDDPSNAIFKYVEESIKEKGLEQKLIENKLSIEDLIKNVSGIISGDNITADSLEEATIYRDTIVCNLPSGEADFVRTCVNYLEKL